MAREGNEMSEEPMKDDELSSLLRKWEVATPPQLESRIMKARADMAPVRERSTWWRFLLRGYIRVPVPLVCCLAILLIAMLWKSTQMAVACQGSVVGPNQGLATAASHAPVATPIPYCPAGTKC